MSVDNLQIVDIIEVMENFLERRRPPEELRSKLDITYKIEGQSVILFEVRPVWDNPSEFIERGVAKATYVKSLKAWKVYWLRANKKWDSFKPCPTVNSIREFITLVENDTTCCFWG